MAFDWTKVEGYDESMTADEKLALLEKWEAPAPDESQQDGEKAQPRIGYIPKKDFDKVSSELAAAKKQLRSRMSEDEQKEADRQALLEAKDAELATLRRDKSLGNKKASFMGVGYDEELADTASLALEDDDDDALFAAMRKYNANLEKALRAKILAETPHPPSSDDPNDEAAKKRDADNLRKYFGLR